MIQINLLYNAYQNTMRILADDQPLNNISALTQYQSMPFIGWCGEILHKIREEVNDVYALTYTGRSCEGRVLASIAARCSDCRALKTQMPTLADTTLKRLRRLHQLCMGGMPYTPFAESLHIYTDFPQETVDGMLRGTMPKLCFCRIKVQYHALADLNTSRRESLRFVLAPEGSSKALMNVIAALPGESYVLELAREDAFVGVQGSCIIEQVTAEMMPQQLIKYLELSFFLQLLLKALRSISISEKDANYPEFSSLDKIEPQTFAALPTSVELNQKLPIRIYTVPDGYEPTPLQYRISNTDVVQIESNMLYGVGTGEAVVEVYQAGQSVCISRTRIVSYRRNRITSLHLKETSLRVSVGDRVRMNLSYAPEDADNASTIRYVSTSGTVASVENGYLVARQPGTTSITVKTDNGVSAHCTVQVFPKLERIELSLANRSLPFNGITKVSVKRIPGDATLDDLVFTVTPQELAVFDRAGMQLAARAAGSGTLIVQDKRKSVSASCDFHVGNKPINWWPIIKVLGGAALVLAVIRMLMG